MFYSTSFEIYVFTILRVSEIFVLSPYVCFSFVQDDLRLNWSRFPDLGMYFSVRALGSLVVDFKYYFYFKSTTYVWQVPGRIEMLHVGISYRASNDGGVRIEGGTRFRNETKGEVTIDGGR